MIRDIHTSNRRKQRKAMRSLAWLNGVEVTHDCFYADDRAGVVRLIRRDEAGHAYYDHRIGDVATAERHGQVRIGRA